MERIAAIARRTGNPVYVPAIALFVAGYVILAAEHPYGNWDAWSIWNLRAMHFAFSDDLRTAVGATVRQPDYPPLLPAVIAMGWRVFGYTPLIPIVLHGAAYAMLLWLLRKDVVVLSIVGAVGLSYAPTQYADTLLALWFTLALANHEHQVLAGICLGLASLTKNEGILMLFAYPVAVLLMERRLVWRTLLATLPFVLTLVLYKEWTGATNDIMSAGGKLERAIDLQRCAITMLFLSLQLFFFAHSSMAVLLCVACLRRIRFTLSASILTVGVVFAGYFATYVLTPHELLWQLSTSSDRLVFHLFPALAYYVSAHGSGDIG